MSTFVPSNTRPLEYAVLDVFAEQALAGNPLAVFPDASSLSPAEMQALARETNLSETTFIVPRPPEVEQQRGVLVRIFTVKEELPFAGHPTLGTATWLYLHHPALRGARRITLELGIGRIPVEFDAPDDRPGVVGTMYQNEPVFGSLHDPRRVARALGLAPDDLDAALPIQTVSTGLPFCIVPLRSLEVAARMDMPRDAAQQYLESSDARFFHCITRADRSSSADWHARMQFYGGEDPATGSASGATAAYLVRYSLAASGQPVVLEQGVEIGRPSRIRVQASGDGVQIRDVRVGGRTVPVASGSFFLPRTANFAQDQNAGAQ